MEMSSMVKGGGWAWCSHSRRGSGPSNLCEYVLGLL